MHFAQMQGVVWVILASLVWSCPCLAQRGESVGELAAQPVMNCIEGAGKY